MSDILVIDDEENMRHMLSALLHTAGLQVTLAADGSQGLQAVLKKDFDCVLCDIKMPKMNGLQFLAALQEQNISVPVVMMSAFGTVEMAVQAMKQGAVDFITKPFLGEEVILALEKAIRQNQLQQENEMLRQQLLRISKKQDFGGLKGKSESLKKVIDQARRAAAYKTTVLITGESGTGKELMAQGVHQESPRKGKPFVAVNCGGIPENLLESEFFGYVKGAFTGADKNKKGLFAEAEGGTLFLDEIGELPMDLQVKFLRVLQESEIRQVGSSQNQRIDVRIIAATAKNLAREIKNRAFREDLYYRLNVLPIHIPPLRERSEDIPLLAHHFVQRINRKLKTSITTITPKAMSILIKHTWPGNVRELENLLERAAILANRNTITPDNLPEDLGEKSRDQQFDGFFTGFSLKTAQKVMEKSLINRALEETNGNKSKAAKLLEISYPSLLSKIKETKRTSQLDPIDR